MNFKDAQQDMRQSFLGGATGVVVSGVVWIVAGLKPVSYHSKRLAAIIQ